MILESFPSLPDVLLRKTWSWARLASTKLPSSRPLRDVFDVTTTSLYPASPGANLEARKEGESGGTWDYREAVGGLMWLVVMSRPDISNAVRAVALH